MKKFFILASMIAMHLSISATVNAAFIPVDISPYYNTSLVSQLRSPIPSVLGGVPFSFDENGDFFHFLNNTSNVLTLNVDIPSPDIAYMLLNTGWGAAGFKSGTISFYTDDNQNWTQVLYNGYNIRNWQYDRSFPNTFTASNVKNVFSHYPNFLNSTGWIDMMSLDLPQSFRGHDLTKIVISDYGRDYYSRIRVEGITVQTVPTPEPGTIMLFVVGCVGLFLLRRQSSSV